MAGKEAQLVTGILADDPFAGELLPPGLRLAIVHDQIAVAQPSGGAEIENLAVKVAVEGDAGVAQGAEGDRYRLTVYFVVDDLVPYEDAQRVGAGHITVAEHDHRVWVFQPLVAGCYGLKLRSVNRRDAVFGRTAGKNLSPTHRASREVG